MNIFQNALGAHRNLFLSLDSLGEVVVTAGFMCAQSLAASNKIMICGNGGSAADAQHIASELTGRFVKDRKALAGLALTTDTSALTSIANDYQFESIFSRQVEGLGKPGDVLIGISTSGNSANVYQAVLTAKAEGIKTIGLLGRDGGKIAPLVDCAIIVPSDTTALIQEAHIFIGHVLCAMIEEQLLGS